VLLHTLSYSLNLHIENICEQQTSNSLSHLPIVTDPLCPAKENETVSHEIVPLIMDILTEDPDLVSKLFTTWHE
jgi:hypothetical protein